MTDVLGQLRKKYTLALLLFGAGSAHAFIYAWSAGEYTTFAGLLLGLFGAADLIDKDKFKKP